MFIISILFFVCMLLSAVMLSSGCGTLEFSYICHDSHIDAMLQLDPTETMKDCLNKASNEYRWWRLKGPIRIYPEDDPKYEESNLTLTIHDIDDSDEGLYTMDCGPCRSRDVRLAKPIKECEIITNSSTHRVITVTGPTRASPTGVILSDTVIVVIAVSAVIIAMVVAGTILVVKRSKPAPTTRRTRRASYEGSSTVNLHCENGSTIYNEIDHDNGKVDNCGFNSSKLSLLSLQRSPPLPKRPDQTKILHENENEYAIIRNSAISDKVETNRNNVDRNKNNSATLKDIKNSPSDDCYAKIVPKAKNLKESTLLNNNTIPEYSKVLKRQATADIEKEPENSKGINNNCTVFSVEFPQINCSEIVKSLDNGLQKNDVAASGEPVEYCNVRSKRRQSKASRKSLQYAILDHTGSEASLNGLSYGPYDLPDFATCDIPTCQYASIDFNKKAFVAPVRKAPSSWYKRRNKDAKKK